MQYANTCLKIKDWHFHVTVLAYSVAAPNECYLNSQILPGSYYSIITLKNEEHCTEVAILSVVFIFSFKCQFLFTDISHQQVTIFCATDYQNLLLSHFQRGHILRMDHHSKTLLHRLALPEGNARTPMQDVKKHSHKSLICSRGWEPGKKQSQLWAIEKPEDRQEEAWRQTGRSLKLLTQETTTLTCTPPTAHNTRMAPSRTLRALSTSTVKSTCPDDCEHFVSKFKAVKIH